MNFFKVLLISTIIFLGGFTPINAQIVDSENKLTVILRDGTNVTLYGKAISLSDSLSSEYYYLPTNLRLSKKRDGTPQFLFMKYVAEEGAEAKGAILHFLMEYGLTKDQERELGQQIKRLNPKATVKGVVNVSPVDTNSIRVISATISNNKMKRSLVLSGHAPTLPGNKIALAANLDKNGAQLFAATLEETSSIADLSITLSYTYDVRFPAAKGYIIEDWSKLDSLKQIDSATYTRSEKRDDVKHYGKKALNGVVGAIIGGPIGAAIGWLSGGSKKKNHFTYDEMQEFYHKMEELNVIEMRFEENLNDERVTKIREMYFQYFLNSFTARGADVPPPPPGKKERKDIPDIKHGDSYQFNRRIVENIVEKRKRVFNLNYATAVKRNFQLTENLASWYNQVRDNKKCVGVVLLNDPFFQHRDVNVVLDGVIEEMLSDGTLNSVNVKLRKNRDAEDAYPFNEDVLVDKYYMKDENEESNRLTFTYSKAQDSNPDVYEYKIKYSFRGGNTIEDTDWHSGDWGILEVNPPVQPFPITFEVSKAEMESVNIRNIAMQLRYMKFDKEVETVVNLRKSSKEEFIEKTIYIDSDANGYAYRLVFYHPDGIMATDWEARYATGYIFGEIPNELIEGNKKFIDQLLEAGRLLKMARGDGKEVPMDEKISEDTRFEGIFEQ